MRASVERKKREQEQGEGQGHTQLLHAVVDQLLLLLFVGDGLRLQLAGLCVDKAQVRGPYSRLHRWGRQGWVMERGLTWVWEVTLRHFPTCHLLHPQIQKVSLNPLLSELISDSQSWKTYH